MGKTILRISRAQSNIIGELAIIFPAVLSADDIVNFPGVIGFRPCCERRGLRAMKADYFHGDPAVLINNALSRGVNAADNAAGRPTVYSLIFPIIFIHPARVFLARFATPISLSVVHLIFNSESRSLSHPGGPLGLDLIDTFTHTSARTRACVNGIIILCTFTWKLYRKTFSGVSPPGVIARDSLGVFPRRAQAIHH